VSVRVVTGYVPLSCAHRSHQRYMELAARLMAIGLPLTAYMQPLADCWLHQYHARRGTVFPDGGKDTPAYHCVQHEKSRWITREVTSSWPQTVVWIDLGVLHLAGVGEQHVADFVRQVAENPPTRITSPSCHPVPEVIDHRSVCWAFCGGVIVVPSHHAYWFHDRCKDMAAIHPPTWEVNTWARVAQEHPDRFSLYQADHDHTLFTGYARGLRL